MRRAAMPSRRVVRKTVRRTAIILDLYGVRKVREYSDNGHSYKDYNIQSSNGHEFYINEDGNICNL